MFVTNSGGIVNFSTTGGPTSNGQSTNAVSAGAITDTDGIGGLVALGSNTLTITNGEGSFAGVISGSGSAGLTIDGGTTTLTGANSYTGATTINGGTLAVDGSGIITSAVTVNLGGTLAGNGTVSGVTVNAGGTLSAGANGSGTLTVERQPKSQIRRRLRGRAQQHQRRQHFDIGNGNEHCHAQWHVHRCGRFRNLRRG